ncbi:molecular chaperone [Pseudidiomarina halophila]|uniref:Pili assembly chaperone N-terminal domain-containing protein n=1 Tax=Pseudidiomarina halophila TaxID=1449799 RepID=A0A432XYV3_9GAMM|nr:fimbria/pilus periplasmic chaperone [Pseudidiomarina halophila]RUO53899.1 hypothetical protein CWI69_00200 [Pseudidiomarina halophila]
MQSLLEVTKGRVTQASKTSLPFYSLFRTSLLILIMGLFVSFPSQADTLGVSPVRVTLSAQNPVASITVKNASDRPKSIQLRLYNWQHEGQKTQLTATKDLIAAPPIAVIPANQTQIVRVGLRIKPDSEIEKSYRLMIEELPPKDNVGIAMTLRISIPVFIAPEKAAQNKLNWRVEHRDDSSFLVVENSGTAHAKINQLSLNPPALTNSAPTGNIYILPNSYYEWKLSSEVKKHNELVVKADILGDAVSQTLPTH